jgi:Ca2+-binding EF-hand superfamily protein
MLYLIFRRKIMKKAALAFFVAALSLVAHPVFAEDADKEKTKDTVPPAFKAADLNGDGGLSREELDKTDKSQFKLIKDNFDAMDYDKDGKVTPAEREKWIKAQRYKVGK